MMSEKSKRQHTLPDRRLAQAFSFSAHDLATNRAGFISNAQAWQMPLWTRSVLGWFIDGLPPLDGRRDQRVQSVCGRTILTYEQQQIMSLFHADFVERHYVRFGEGGSRFRITPEQYRALVEGVPYRAYYTPERSEILSLERMTRGCSE